MSKLAMMCVFVVSAAAGGTQGLHGNWASQDIGEIKAPGSATYDKGKMTWTVQGAGYDIFWRADSFQYVYRRLRGDCSIIARIESFDKTDPWAKCGVMIRETREPNSGNVGLFITPNNGVRFQYRPTTGAKTNRIFVVDITTPLWVKLERKGNQFSAYYASGKKDPVWKTMTEKPQEIALSRTVYVGLAVTSHLPGVLSKARLSNVAVSGIEGGIIDAEILADPEQALQEAYRDLERLGNWEEDTQTIKQHGNLIAGSLLAIARTKELSSEPVDKVLPLYYRVTETVPDSPFSIDALIRIAVLDGEKGLEYAQRHLKTGSTADRDRFHVAVAKGYSTMSESPAREAAIKSFVNHVGQSLRFTLLEQVIAGLDNHEQAESVCKSLIQHGMDQPSNVRVAVVALRYMALKRSMEQTGIPILQLSRWAATRFKDTRLSACAMAVLADAYYKQGFYVEAVEAFLPELFSGNQSELKTVENIENTLAYYRANTLLLDTIDLERIYQGLADKASGLELNIVALHCQRKVAAIEGLSLEHFEESAQKDVKYCESSPENEFWFWKGLVAAEAGDLGKAAAAYEHFVQGDGKSVLAARAYYDIARAKMAIGEDAREWVAKSKALSPCDAVIQLERRLRAMVSL